MTHPNWDDLRVFLAVARSGQLLAAAKRLGVNHATVSRRVQQLEAALGQTLVHRRTHGCDLTEAGQRLLVVAERVEREVLSVGAERDAGAVSGTVRVGAPDGFGLHFIAPRLGELADRHPGIRVELVPMGRSVSISRREADLVVTLARPEQASVVARKLVDYALGLYASRDYLVSAGEPESASALAAHRLVGYVDDLVYSDVLDYTREFSAHWQTDTAIASAVGQLEAVRGGAGIGILHRYIAETHTSLQRVLPELSVTRSYWLARHESTRSMGAINAVADFLVEAVDAARTQF
ncbi:MAG: LysR family transcriptional regulator [Pseudomonadota bacterium]